MTGTASKRKLHWRCPPLVVGALVSRRGQGGNERSVDKKQSLTEEAPTCSCSDMVYLQGERLDIGGRRVRQVNRKASGV